MFSPLFLPSPLGNVLLTREGEMAFLCFSGENMAFGKVLLFNHENSGAGEKQKGEKTSHFFTPQ